jgi:hypothetical protein
VGFHHTCCAIPHSGFLPNSLGLSESFEMKEVYIFVSIGTSFAVNNLYRRVPSPLSRDKAPHALSLYPPTQKTTPVFVGMDECVRDFLVIVSRGIAASADFATGG